MAVAHTRFHSLLAGQHLEGRAFHWQHVVGLLQELCKERSTESEALLRQAAQFKGTLKLDEAQGLPHSMSPEDFLRSVAVQTLGRWDPVLHQDAIVRAVALADHESVEAHARPYLI